MSRIGIIYMKNCNKNDRLDFIFLKNVRKFYNRLIVVCDTILGYGERYQLEQLTKEIIVERFSSEIMAWRFCYTEYLTEEDRNCCNELTLISLNFFGLIKDYETLVLAMNNMEGDVINICPFDLTGDSLSVYSGFDYLIFKRRVLEDYSFGKFLQNQNKKDILDLFRESGFRCINYSGSEDFFILPKSRIKSLSIDRNDCELKKNIKSIIDSADIYDGTKDGLIRNIVINNSTESMRNLFDLDFVLESQSKTLRIDNFTLCMFIETEEGLEIAKKIIQNTDNGWNYYVWLREEEFLDQITQESDTLKVGLFYRECMWERIVNVVEQCQDYLIGFIFENGDILNFQNNFENLFMNDNLVAQLQQFFHENNYMAAILPKRYIDSDRFIRNELYRIQLQNIPEFREISWDIEIPECAICCRTDILRDCIGKMETENTGDEGKVYVSWCETESIKIVPHLLQINGYMVGHAICDTNLLEYSRRLYEINEKQIRICMKSGRLPLTNFGEYLNNTKRLLEGYYILYNKVKKLNQENKKLSAENNKLKKRKVNVQVKEVPVLVNIGVKQAVKNWVKKQFGKESNS